MQSQFYKRLAQGQSSFDNTDQGTWAIPMQHQGQEDTYFTGNSTNYYTNQQSVGDAGSGQIGGGSSEGMSPVFSTGMTSYNNKSTGGNKGLQKSENTHNSLGNQSQYMSDTQLTVNNSHFAPNQVSMPERIVGKMNLSSQDDSDTGYYGFPKESYMTNSGGNVVGMNSVNSMNMGGGGNSVNMGDFRGSSMNIGSNPMNIGGSSLNLGGNSVNMGNNNSAMGGSGMGMANSGNFAMNLMENYGTDSMMMGMSSGANNMGISNGVTNLGMSGGANNMSISHGVTNLGMSGGANNMCMNNGRNSVAMGNSGSFGNAQLQNQLMAAAVGMGALATWHEHCGNNPGFNNANGNFGNNKRGKRGKGFGVNRYKGTNNRYKGTDMFSHDGTMLGGQDHSSGGNNISLSATNHNTWCFLRKNFNKRDNDLAEHLFDFHEKFCHHCRERIEERKYRKKKKYSDEPKEIEGPPEEKEVPDEELTEEELQIKRLMGFAGFKTTKGFRVKDNNYSTVSSLNTSGSSEAIDETSTLTEAEKRMIILRGGFSVFSKPDISELADPGFGAPAVTFDSVDGSGPGYSNKPLFNKKS